jgi:hypothetical protein
VDCILETFPSVKRKDEQALGEYRTKRVILDIYDAMQQAMEMGIPYHTPRPTARTRLDTTGNHARGGNETTE